MVEFNSTSNLKLVYSIIVRLLLLVAFSCFSTFSYAMNEAIVDSALSVTMPAIRLGNNHYSARFDFDGNFTLSSLEATDSPPTGVDGVDLATGNFNIDTLELELFCVLYNDLEYEVVLKQVPATPPGVTIFSLHTAALTPGCTDVRVSAVYENFVPEPFVEPIEWETARMHIATGMNDLYGSVEPFNATLEQVQTDYQLVVGIFGDPSFGGDRNLECQEFAEFWLNNSGLIQTTMDQTSQIMREYMAFAHMASFIVASNLLTSIILDHDMATQLAADELEQHLLDRANTEQDLNDEAPRLIELFVNDPLPFDFSHYTYVLQGTWLTVFDPAHLKMVEFLNPFAKSQYDLLIALEETTDDAFVAMANVETKMQNAWSLFGSLAGTDLCVNFNPSETDAAVEGLINALSEANNTYQNMQGVAIESVLNLDGN